MVKANKQYRIKLIKGYYPSKRRYSLTVSSLTCVKFRHLPDWLTFMVAATV